jgi:DNA-binding NtrC family response regulator/tetratricopeptide (TPR) repeat protein
MASLAQLLGESPAMSDVREQVHRLLASAAAAHGRLPPILILGETGTGKGLLAGSIHRQGSRAAGPFVDLNCAAIPETLLESELFGFERGAFTDARQAKPGLFQTADGGTLFLDEIGLMPLPLQSKLLRAIEDRTVRRLGGTRSESIDASVIAATSEDLPVAVRAGRFRRDLYHRLAVVTLALPPLRDRGTDVILLAEHFLRRVCEDYGLAARHLSPDAHAALLTYPWPGNVRELSNTMERAALLGDGPLLTARNLQLPGRRTAAAPLAPADAAAPEDPDGEEARRLLEVLTETEWNFTRAAVRLGVPRNTLRYRIERLGLSPQSASPRRRGGRPPRSRVATPPVTAPSATAPARETRRVTLLLATLVAPGPGEVIREGDRALEAMAEKLRSFGGRVHDVSATTVLALFGVEPEEDAPQRAAHAAIALQQLATRARLDDPRRPDLRLAIHVAPLPVRVEAPGLAVVAAAIDDARSALEALIDAAPARGIAASEPASRLLIGRFDLTPLPAAPGARLVRHAERGRTPFVGRERELQFLAERFERAQAGEGQMVLIVGEPGVGKSRLLHELRRGLQSRATWIEGQALPFARSTPFHAVMDMLRRVFRIDDVDPEAAVIEKIERGVRRLAADLDPVLPLVRYLLSVDPGDPAVATMDPKQRHAALVSATHLMLERGAALRTHVLALEDVHWADAATEDWLARLSERIASQRVLLVATTRPGHRVAFGGGRFHTSLTLPTLSTAESVQMAEGVCGVAELPAELERLVADKAEGNPFFVEELMRSLWEVGLVRRAAAGLAVRAGIEAMAVPDTIQEVILARIQRLDHAARRLLGVAAVIGKDVPFALLEAVTGLPEAALATDLRRLLAAEFLLETRMHPEVEHTFKHALTQDVAYGAVEDAERRALHARIVQAMEELYPQRQHDHAERLAHHALNGELWPRAVQHCRRAGEKAFDRSANREAVVWWERSLEAVGRQPERDGMDAAIDLRLALRSALLQLGEFGRIATYLREAEALANAAGDRRRLAWARTYMTNAHLFAGEPTQGLAVGEQAVALADAVGDVGLRATARTPLAHACREVGDCRRAIRLLQEAIDMLTGDLLRQRLGQGMPPAIYARNMAAICHAELGQFAESERFGTESEDLARSPDLPWGLALARIALAYRLLLQDRPADAEAAVERAIDVIRTREVPAWLPWAAAVRGYALALSGRAAEGIGILEQAIDKAVALPFLFGHSQWLAWLAHAHGLAGHADTAARLATDAVRLSRERGERGYEAWALWVRGEVCLDGEDTRAALSVASDLGMLPLVGRAHLSLGELYRRAGDLVEAAREFAHAARELDALDMTESARRARSALTALSPAR